MSSTESPPAAATDRLTPGFGLSELGDLQVDFLFFDPEGGGPVP